MLKWCTIVIVSALSVIFIKSEVINRSICEINEMHIECVHCGPKHCSDLGHPVPCGGATALCKPECVCIDGYVRDGNGTCIPKKDCSQCGGDKNATSGCGNHCGNSCADYRLNKTCLSGCRYNGCDCKTGYVFHEALNLCVLPADCCKFLNSV